MEASTHRRKRSMSAGPPIFSEIIAKSGHGPTQQNTDHHTRNLSIGNSRQNSESAHPDDVSSLSQSSKKSEFFKSYFLGNSENGFWAMEKKISKNPRKFFKILEN